jgi:hypothetical protein
MAVELRRGGVHKGLVPCLIHQNSYIPRRNLSIYLSIIPLFLLNSSFFTLPSSEMSVYLHPLSIPSRNNSTSSESPLSQSVTSAAWSTTTTPSRRSSESTHFLGIPGPSTPQIKDADSVDKEANAAAAAAAATTATSSPSSQGMLRFEVILP